MAKKSAYYVSVGFNKPLTTRQFDELAEYFLTLLEADEKLQELGMTELKIRRPTSAHEISKDIECNELIH